MAVCSPLGRGRRNAASLVSVIAGLLLIAAVACDSARSGSAPVWAGGVWAGAPTPDTQPEVRNVVPQLPPVGSVRVVVNDSLEYSLLIESGLPDSSVKFERYELNRDGSRIEVTVTNHRHTRSAACLQVYEIHEGELALGSDFTPGETYVVVVNGEVTNAFAARDPDDSGMVVAESPIDKVEIVILESFPPQYRLSIVSRLPLGSKCSKFNGYDVTRPYRHGIRVRVTHLEVANKNVACTRDMPVVISEVGLGSDFFTPGE